MPGDAPDGIGYGADRPRRNEPLAQPRFSSAAMVLQVQSLTLGATEMPRLQQEEDAAADANWTNLRDARLRESKHRPQG